MSECAVEKYVLTTVSIDMQLKPTDEQCYVNYKQPYIGMWVIAM